MVREGKAEELAEVLGNVDVREERPCTYYFYEGS